VNTKGTIAGSYGKSIFSFVRNCQPVFQSICAILYFHQCRPIVPTSLSVSGIVKVLDFDTYFNTGNVVSHCFNLKFVSDIWE
jgi:hypothetical protein